MRLISTEQLDEKIKVTQAVETVVIPEQRWPALLFLVVLIVVEIGAMVALCYRLDHPTVQIDLFKEMGKRTASL